jgi:acyl transferase domain-containing protein
VSPARRTVTEPIAIIGMSCRVPGADTLPELWQLLVGREQRFRTVPSGRWQGLESAPGDTVRAALLDDIDGFDARFFGIAPRMAVWMDPQQRMLLELAQHAMENAGLPPERLSGEPVAVLVGAFLSEYRDRMIAAGTTDTAAFPGTLMTFLANRISYQFGWTGPSMVIDSACSSSLSAVSVAVQGLLAGDFPLAVVAAANLTSAGFYPRTALLAGALSPTGRSVPFSADRDGYVRGEGGACVVLKPLKEALADGDPVHAVIKAVCTAHNGRGGGLTATDSASMVKLMESSAARAGLSVRDLGFLEAHGTGTRSGDLAEIQAVAEVMDAARSDGREGAGPEGKIWIGSIKANIGHLEGAAGLVGLVKAALAVQHGVIPGVAGLSSPDPGLPLTESVGVTGANVSWPLGAGLRRAAVNSFGLGGALSHAIVEQPVGAEAVATKPGSHRRLIVPICARSDSSVKLLARRLVQELALRPAIGIADVSWTLQFRRGSAPVRRVFVAATTDELRELLNEFLAGDEAVRVGRPAQAASDQELVTRWLDGETVDWSGLWDPLPAGRPVHLPGTPFDHKPYWFDDLFAAARG